MARFYGIFHPVVPCRWLWFDRPAFIIVLFSFDGLVELLHVVVHSTHVISWFNRREKTSQQVDLNEEYDTRWDRCDHHSFLGHRQVIDKLHDRNPLMEIVIASPLATHATGFDWRTNRPTRRNPNTRPTLWKETKNQSQYSQSKPNQGNPDPARKNRPGCSLFSFFIFFFFFFFGFLFRFDLARKAPSSNNRN